MSESADGSGCGVVILMIICGIAVAFVLADTNDRLCALESKAGITMRTSCQGRK